MYSYLISSRRVQYLVVATILVVFSAFLYFSGRPCTRATRLAKQYIAAEDYAFACIEHQIREQGRQACGQLLQTVQALEDEFETEASRCLDRPH